MPSPKLTVAPGDHVWLRGYMQRSGTPGAVVRRVTPRRIIVWTGATGWGQKEWPFDRAGLPVGQTLLAFPHVKLEAEGNG